MIRRLAVVTNPEGGEGKDEGFAMVTVVGTMLVLTLFVIAATTFAVNAMPSSRRAQDYAAAMAAAQVGIDDVVSRLNQCDTYWSTPCPGSPAEPARWDGNASGAQTNKWAAVPGAAESRNARYRYTLVSTPASGEAGIRVRADGEVNGVRRTITADLGKKSFLNYIYYTDYESISPQLYVALYGGTEAAASSRCGRYYYAVPGETTGTRESGMTTKRCDINFVSKDVIRGKLHTNDAMLISGTPQFLDTVTTNWRPEFTPGSDPAAPYRKATTSSAPAGNVPKISDKGPVNLPASNSALKTDAANGGCVFEGPTRVELNSSGQMRVTSPLTTTLNSGCVKDVWTNLPANGVLYAVNSTKAPSSSYCTADPAGSKTRPTGVYPIPSTDVTSYSCTAGDVFLEGTLKGQLTIGAMNDIIVTDDVKYNTPVWNSSTGVNQSATDVLGLVADGSVQTYHPVTSGGGELASAQVMDLEIDAAILSVNESFMVQNYNKGTTSGLGKLQVRGGIYQRYRGPVGTSSGTGYAKDYVYDSRLVSLPPPHFLEPTGSAWGVTGLSE